MYHDSGDGEPGCSQVTLTDVRFTACGKFTACNQRGHENRAPVSLFLLLDAVASRTSCSGNWEFSNNMDSTQKSLFVILAHLNSELYSNSWVKGQKEGRYCHNTPASKNFLPPCKFSVVQNWGFIFSWFWKAISQDHVINIFLSFENSEFVCRVKKLLDTYGKIIL